MNSSNSQNNFSGKRLSRKPYASSLHSVASIALAVIVVAGLTAVLFPAESDARLVLDFGNQQRFFEGRVVSGMTILDALNASVVAGGIPLQFVIQDGQAKIVGADARIGGQPITVSLNGQQIDPSGIYSLPIRAQDEVVIKLFPEDTE